jgi:hypothetical protein
MTAADLDARLARDCEWSGVPFHVEDPAVLGLVVDLLAAAPTPATRRGGRDAA